MGNTKTTRKIAAWLAWLTTLAFIVTVVVPILVQRTAVTDDSKMFFVSFELKDLDGRTHTGWFCPGFNDAKDSQMVEYGYQVPPGIDVNSRRQKFVDSGDKAVTKDGFVWGDNGYLWASFYTFEKRGFVKEGARLGLTIPHGEQTEITLPGAPWDVQTPNMSLFGKFPNYDATFNNEFFDIDLKMVSRTPGWTKYNRGVPFQAGDFGLGSMNEIGANVTGTIKHKKTGQTFTVAGTALVQDSTGMPWGWASWGAHDWTSIHFDGGWDGSIWKAKDNWQWGYRPSPHNGWLNDPQLKKKHYFDRVEIVDAEYETDENTGAKWPKHITWRAIAEDATLVMESKSQSWLPGGLEIAGSPFTMKMSHGLYTANATLIRNDGSTVELKNGAMIGEHYEDLFPDYVHFGPLMLALLVLTWSGYAVAIRREAGRGMVAPAAWCALGLFATWALYFAWLKPALL